MGGCKHFGASEAQSGKKAIFWPYRAAIGQKQMAYCAIRHKSHRPIRLKFKAQIKPHLSGIIFCRIEDAVKLSQYG